MTTRTSIIILLSLAIPFSQHAGTVDPEDTSIELGEPDGEYLGYQYVDLGLESGNLWAIHNIGTDVPEGEGLYFAWGEVEPKEFFSVKNYEFYLGDEFHPEEGRYRVYENIG